MRIALLLMAGCSLLPAQKPLLHALVTSGWNEKPDVEFTVNANRNFVWRSGTQERKGSVDPVALTGLISHIRAATPGLVANDVGMLQVTWKEKTGRTGSKVFYFPRQAPALELIQEIDTLTAKYSKEVR